jgi:hypothetical protein
MVRYFFGLLLIGLVGCSNEATQLESDQSPYQSSANQETKNTYHLQTSWSKTDGPVKTTLTLERAEVRPGETINLTLDITIEDGWHIYGSTSGPNRPTSLSIETLDRIYVEPGDNDTKPALNVTSMGMEAIYQGEVRWTRRLTIAPDAPTSRVDLSCILNFQACDHNQCLPPRTIVFAPRVSILAKE